MANQQMNDNRQPPQQQQAGPRDLNQKQGAQNQFGKKQSGQNPQRRDSKH